MAFEVRSERRGHVAVVTIDNPPVNALHPDVAAAIHDRVPRGRATTRSVRAIVLTGAGEKHFMAGGDINFIQTLDRVQGRALRLRRAGDAGLRSGSLPQPVIAALNGTTLGGGLELAMACDIRIAEEHAVFGQPEVSLGIIPGAGGTQNLPRLVPVGRAKKLLFTGERIAAEEALAIGLVDEVVPRGASLERARRARRGDRPQRADGGRRRQARRQPRAAGRASSTGTGSRARSSRRSPRPRTSRKASRAFLEKRPPEFHRE